MEAHDHWQTGTYWAVSLGKFKCLVFSSGWSIKRFARWVLLTLAVRYFLQLLSKFPGSNFQVASGSQSSFESREHSIHGLLADRCEGNRYVEVNGRYFCQLLQCTFESLSKSWGTVGTVARVAHGSRFNVLNLESPKHCSLNSQPCMYQKT